MSKADDLTENSLIKLEKKIKSEYQKAYDSMRATYDEYINGSTDGKTLSLAERFQIEEKKYLNGAYTDKEWNAWKQTQIQRGERYKAMVDDMAHRLTNTNQIASAYINDQTPSIYSLNQNYQAYEIGRGKNGIDFIMYDEQTVKNMIMDEEGEFTEFRTVKINPQRDYAWNRQQINSALLSGILQGKSINKIADSFEGVMGRNRSSAIRNARTAYTSAQNGGRLNSLKQAKAQGINVRKQWLSAHDGRVRDSHAMLNGQIRDIEDRFDNGLLYPADSEGRPAEVYNCRCTLTYIYPEWDSDVSSEIYNDEKLAGETYPQFVKRMKENDPDRIDQNRDRYKSKNQIKKEKLIGKTVSTKKTQKAKAPVKIVNTNVQLANIRSQLDDQFVDAMEQRVNNPAVASKSKTIEKLFNKTQGDLKVIDSKKSSGAFFKPTDQGIHFNAVKDMAGSSYQVPYEVSFHEFGHNMDFLLGGKNMWSYLSNQRYNGKRLKETIKEDYLAFKKANGAKKNSDLIAMLKGEGLPQTTTGNVSDILEYCTNTSYPLGIGHGASYHKKSEYATEKEFFAEVVSSAVLNKDSYDYMVRIFPNAVDQLWNMIEGAL